MFLENLLISIFFKATKREEYTTHLDTQKKDYIYRVPLLPFRCLWGATLNQEHLCNVRDSAVYRGGRAFLNLDDQLAERKRFTDNQNPKS